MRTTNSFTAERQLKAAAGNRGLPPMISTFFLAAGLTLFAGCEAENVKTVPSPQIKHGKTSQTPEPENEVLPPQSEPPLADTQEKPSTPTDETNEAAKDEPKPKVYALFDGETLEHWKRSNFGGEGEVEVVDGAIIMQRGSEITGIHWTGDPLPKINYEVSLQAQRIDGSDFFCGIVFPAEDEFCSFVAGGWGGSTIGLSSVDGMYAAENETGTSAAFEDKKWYKFRLRVSEHAVTAWIDGKQYVYLKTKGRKLSLHPAMDSAKPFGIACFATVAGLKDIQLRELTDKEIAAEKEEAEKK